MTNKGSIMTVKIKRVFDLFEGYYTIYCTETKFFREFDRYDQAIVYIIDNNLGSYEWAGVKDEDPQKYIESQKNDLLKIAIHDNEIGQKHVHPVTLFDGLWYCYRGIFGWSKPVTTKDACYDIWNDYCGWLETMDAN